MMSLRQMARRPETIPATTAWYLADLAEALGKQELFTKQSPQIGRYRTRLSGSGTGLDTGIAGRFKEIW